MFYNTFLQIILYCIDFQSHSSRLPPTLSLSIGFETNESSKPFESKKYEKFAYMLQKH